MSFRKTLAVVALVCLPIAVAGQVTNPTTRIQSTSFTPDGGCSGSYAGYADGGFYGCFGGHLGSISGGGGGGGATDNLIPVSVQPGGSCSGVDTHNIGFYEALTGGAQGGSILTPMYCDGSIWKALGVAQFQVYSPGGVPPFCAGTENIWVFDPATSTANIWGCGSSDGGMAYKQALPPFLTFSANTQNGILIDNADAGRWVQAAPSGAMTIDVSGATHLTNVSTNGVAYGQSGGTLATTSVGATGQVLMGLDDSAPAFLMPTAKCTLDASSPATCTATVDSVFTACACGYNTDNTGTFNSVPNCSIAGTTLTVVAPNGTGYPVLCWLAP